MALLVKTLSIIQLKAPVSLQILMMGIQNTKPKNGRLAKPATSIWFMPTERPMPNRAMTLGQNMPMVIQP